MQERMYDTNDMNHTQSHQLRSFVLGAALGAGIALLLAPATGSDTRKKLGGAARRLRERTADTLHEMRHEAEEAVEAGKETYRQTRDTLSAAGSKSGDTRPR
jgi:gas vesicle protein